MPSLLKIAIPCPLRSCFDYLAEQDVSFWQAGMRVKLTFNNRPAIGVVVSAEAAAENNDKKLKYIEAPLDTFSLIPAELFQLITWVSQYYHHPVGECFVAALPKRLRLGDTAELEQENWWQLSQFNEQKLGTKQQQIVDLLSDYPDGLSQTAIKQYLGNVTASLNTLHKKNIIKQQQLAKQPIAAANLFDDCVLNEQQQQVIDAVELQQNQFQPVLLEGVTGSGKTEVYIALTQQQLKQHKQVLILIPEIGLTGQFVERFRQRLNARIVVLHSSVSDVERKQAWLLAREGLADVIIGTRSAIFTPLKQPGLIVIDEEHDGSYKQQDGLRYHARNVALVRAKRLSIPIVMGSATPSLESLYQVEQQRYQKMQLTLRAGGASLPEVKLLDTSQVQENHGLSSELINRIAHHIEQGNQVLLFINRRGFAPVLMCHSCHWQARCEHCDARMVVHQYRQQLFCHHCGWIKRLVDACPECESTDIQTYGAGTEKIEQVLQTIFPSTPVLRVDRDTTQRKHAFADLVSEIKQGQARILVGTQMLAKGHDFHDVTLVGVLDADQGLFSVDFRATETLAQLITQVTGRAGRGKKKGEVLIQTTQPQHPFWKQLLQQGYPAAAESLLQQRKQMMMPPVNCWAVIRAEAKDNQLAMQFLGDVLDLFNQHPHPDVICLGPVPAVMEKKAGRYRAQLLLNSQNRSALHQLLDHYMEPISKHKLSRKLRWSVDIDPVDLL
jgi:primosomal protein N' (replication factor Y)